ncbi:MAG: hypothetical protein ABI634_05885 [Acidobacteriota bacterium]
MNAVSRREFGRVVLASIPAAAVFGPSAALARGRVTVGVSAASFRDLARVTGSDNVDEIILATRAVRATYLELALANVEPAPPAVAPFMGGSAAYPRRIVPSPEQVAATNADARAALRAWRGQAAPGVFEGVRNKLAAAGLTVPVCAVAFNDSFTDDEIDATFEQTKAIGAAVISSPMTMAMAARLAPFAVRHQLSVAIHNQVDGNAAGAIATGDLQAALALSPAFTLKLDIGNLTASNCDAVSELRRYQSRVALVLVKDRLRNGGASQPFGEGDTPIAAVLDTLKTSTRPIPAIIEYDYVGLHPVIDEIAALMTYVAERS